MSDQEFLAPADLNQACGLLANGAIKPLAIAGGTDVMVRFNRHRRRREETLVYLGKLGLDYIREENGQVLVGACATLNRVSSSPLVKEKLPLLAAATGEMASPAVRNAATLGGNVVNNARFADGVAALTALDAKVVIATTAGERVMGMEEFATTPAKQKLADGGIVKHFAIAPLAAGEKWAWQKAKQRQGESRSIVNVSLRATLAQGKVAGIRLVVGCMAANPFVSKAAAQMLAGQAPTNELCAQVAAKVVEECDPVSDARASAWYRSKVTAVMVQRVLAELA